MRFTVIDKLTKRVTYPILILNWLLFIVIVVMCRVNNFDLLETLKQSGLWLLVMAWCYIIAVPLSTVICLWFCATYVTIDENGTKLCIGRLTINQLTWNEIKRIEIFEEISKITRPIINVMNENKPSKLSLRHKNGPNIHKSHFTFMYDSQAIDIIQKYCQCNIDGLDIAEKYK